MKDKCALVIGAGGGHLTEALAATNNLSMQRIFVTFKLPHSKKTLKNEKTYFVIDPHKSIFKYMINFIQSFLIILKVRPYVVINTGGGISIACSLFGKIFGSKLIFIESGARVNRPSKTGKFLYRYSDLFIMQWPGMMRYYPKAVYGGLLI